ncbi:MAG: hypothetical protein JSW48_16630 [Betaproteobacteria bacterium]|jgi:hypothetical protein|nr:MAG: hypothetical protein JSW48_16630 [Betaproteobacteria bacterium]
MNIAQIRSGNTTNALRRPDFAELAERSLPGPILSNLQQVFLCDVETLSQSWLTGHACGGPTNISPQPLDLDTLDIGDNGMAPKRSTRFRELT